MNAADRTVGVLTKADLIPVGSSVDQWLKILRGEHLQVGLGYFVTSRPQGRDLNELAQWEDRVFDSGSSEKWPRDFDAYSDRCGVERLISYLSESLGHEFAKKCVYKTAPEYTRSDLTWLMLL